MGKCLKNWPAKTVRQIAASGCQRNTYVQDCMQVLFNKYFIFDSVICHLHITSYVTDLGVLW